MKTSLLTVATASARSATLSGNLTPTMKTFVTAATRAPTPTVHLTYSDPMPISKTAQTLGDALNLATA